jgi:dienelactone hydrolase
MLKQISFICLALTLAAPSALNAQTAAALPSIKPTGPYAIGRQRLYWTDSSRRDPVDPSRYREVSGWVWYPASGSTDAQEPPLPSDWQALRIESLSAKLGAVVAAAMKSFYVHERTNAKPLSGRSRFPVLLFVPGLSWLASDYSVLIDDLVSHGYVVVGISPTGFSEPIEFPDGRVVRRSLGVGDKIGADQSYVHDDALFALRKIRELSADGFLRGRLDINHIGAVGHSLGGTTSLVVAARDTTVRAAINIDGDPMGDVVKARPGQPVLLISSESPTIEEAPPMASAERQELVRQGLERSEKRRSDDWAAISSQSVSARRISIPGTHHLNFEDAALASALITDKSARWMKFGTMEPERALSTLSLIVRTFFDQSFGRAGKGG